MAGKDAPGRRRRRLRGTVIKTTTTMEVLRRRFTEQKRNMSVSETMEVVVPTTSDATFRLRWQIPKYTRTVARCHSLDSPVYEVRVNGNRVRWSLSLRFWRGPGGRWVRDPAVLCLNMVSCSPSRPQQATVRFQMEVLDGGASRWQRVGPCGRVALQLRASEELLSLDHRDLSVRKRHVLAGGAVCLGVSLQLCLSEEDAKGLVADLDNLLNSGTGDVVILGEDGCELRAHRCILAVRSPVLADMLEGTDVLELKGVSEEVLTEVLRYIYTDRVERLRSVAEPLLEAARTLKLSALEDRCVHCLLEQRGGHHQRKTLMSIAHPGLFDEMGSSSSSGLGSLPTSDSECDLSSPEILDSDAHQGISFTVNDTAKAIQ